MNRGAARRPIFHERRDGRHFLRLVGEGVERSGVEIHAFCLMGNHFHLLVHCPAGGLSEFMHRLGSMYTRFLHHRLETDGPIFRGRFRSLVVDDEAYLLAASRYIHRNPLDVRPSVRLEEYEWSSLGAHLGHRPVPPWLSTARTLELHGDRASLRAFVTDSAARCHPPISWALDSAIAFAAEGLELPHLRRTVALLALDGHEGVLGAKLRSHLALPSADAARMALSRARRRAVDHPEVWSVVRTFVELANG